MGGIVITDNIFVCNAACGRFSHKAPKALRRIKKDTFSSFLFAKLCVLVDCRSFYSPSVVAIR